MRPPPGRPWVIAHRGASADFPENTAAAFRAAAAQGADGVEFDVRRTADGRLVIHHDPYLPGFGAIVDLTAAALHRLAPAVPTLAEALAACTGMWVDVEVKNSPADPDWDPADALTESVVAEMAAARRFGTAWLTSFNPATLDHARRCNPDLPTGWLLEADQVLAPALSWAERAGHTALLPHADALAGEAAADTAEAAHRAGLLLVTWTVDDPTEARRLAASGLDGIITNRPGELRRAFGEHRHHHRS